MVWMITVIGFTLNIPDTVMGLTFVAAGVSLPDALGGIAVAKYEKVGLDLDDIYIVNTKSNIMCLVHCADNNINDSNTSNTSNSSR